MREQIRELRKANNDIRALLAEADERINRVIFAHFLTHEKELETEFSLFQEIRARLLWLFAREEKGLILRFRQGEELDRADFLPLRDLAEKITSLFSSLRNVTDGYTPPTDGCPTFEAMTENLATLQEKFYQRNALADKLYANLTGGKK